MLSSWVSFNVLPCPVCLEVQQVTPAVWGTGTEQKFYMFINLTVIKSFSNTIKLGQEMDLRW